MSLPLPRTLTVLAAVALTGALLTGCGSTAQPASTETADAGTATTAPADAQPDASAAPTASAVAVTCEDIVNADTLANLVAQGWTAKETPFAAGGVTLDDGLQCTWADYDVPSGNLMLFGWASLTSDQASTMQRGLESDGWRREESGGSVYITDSMQALETDDDGYGMTYLFGDGWVAVADTKQNLLLIRQPGA